MINEVSLAANNEVGNNIDSRFGDSLPLLMMRQKYKLSGHRGGVPDIVFSGRFTDLDREATLAIDGEGQLEWGFKDEAKKRGRVILTAGTPDQIRGRLGAVLASIDGKNLSLATQFGTIRDADDIEAALLLADAEEGKEFKASFCINLRDWSIEFLRFCVKVSLCAGLKVLGPEWAFSPAGNRLRSAMLADDPSKFPIQGKICASLPLELRAALGIGFDRHIIAVFPGSKTTIAIISLFGDAFGTVVVDLGVAPRGAFYNPAKDAKPIDCLFQLQLDAKTGRTTFLKKAFTDLAFNLNDLLFADPFGRSKW